MSCDEFARRPVGYELRCDVQMMPCCRTGLLAGWRTWAPKPLLEPNPALGQMGDECCYHLAQLPRHFLVLGLPSPMQM